MSSVGWRRIRELIALLLLCGIFVGPAILGGMRGAQIRELELTLSYEQFDQRRYEHAVAWHHIRQSLLKSDDPIERRRRFDGIVGVYGDGIGDGIRTELAKMGDREPYASLLVHLGGPPLAEPIEIHALADQIDTLPLDAADADRLRRIVGELLDVTLNPYDPVDRMRAEASDYLAIACMKRLLESGDAHHDLIRRYIDKRIGSAEHHGGELRKLREKLPAPE